MYRSKKSSAIAALAAAASLALSATAFAAGEEHGHEHGKSQTKLILNQGKKWQTDSVAKSGMESVRAALAADLKAIHSGRQSDTQYAALAQNVNAEIANMVKNCKLEPEVDEQFHQVIAEMMAGAGIMEGKVAGEARRKGAEQIARALNDYGRHFEHPGWKRI